MPSFKPGTRRLSRAKRRAACSCDSRSRGRSRDHVRSKTASPFGRSARHKHAAGDQTGRGGDRPAPVPLGAKRVPDQRAPGAAARHSRTVHGHRLGPGFLRHHRTGAHRAGAQLEALRPARHHRRSRGHHQVQDQEAAGRGQAGVLQAESVARERHLRRGGKATGFAEAPGVEGTALRGTARADARAAAPSAGQQGSRAGWRGRTARAACSAKSRANETRAGPVGQRTRSRAAAARPPHRTSSTPNCGRIRT